MTFHARAGAADGILVAGTASGATRLELRVCRFIASTLALDTDFGTGGCAAMAPSSADLRVRAVAVAADGSIYASGTAPGSNDDFFVAKLGASGTPVGGFGTGGLLMVNIYGGGSGTLAGLRTMSIDHVGRILLAGSAKAAGATAYQAVIVRISADGVRDTGFGTGGVAFVGATGPTGPVHSFLGTLLVDPDSNAMSVVYWSEPSPGPSNMVLTHFSEQGGVGSGYVQNWDGTSINYPRRLLRQCDKLLLAGDSNGGTVFGAPRILTDTGMWNTDPPWGTEFGRLLVTPTGGYGTGIAVADATLSAGHLVLAGTVLADGDLDWLVVRLTNSVITCNGFEGGEVGLWQ